ncbi:hypothetical protein LIU39_32475 [Streptomyces sp. SF28]|nr:hypothetical protein [Streptomyces pinistramenti]
MGDHVRLTSTWDPTGRLATQSLLAAPTAPSLTEAATGGSDTSGIHGAAPGFATTQPPHPATPSPSLLHHRAYTYRADGHLTAIDDSHTGRRTFDLDRAGRVTAVHATDWTETYAYDEAGNQTHATWPDRHPNPSARGDRTYTGTRITRAGTLRYEHDPLGRVTLRQKTRLSRKPDTWHYTWNTEDRLTSVITPDGVTWRYLYDAFGRRVAKERLGSDAGTATEESQFVWDGAVLSEQTTHHQAADTHVVTLTWEHKGLNPVSQTERKIAGKPDTLPQCEVDKRFFAFVTDLVGSPTKLISTIGEVAWHTRSTVWGITAWSVDATAYTPLRFPGQYFDPETQLHYNYHRFYDTQTACYISPDPLGLRPAPNIHTYVSNPLSGVDPLGLSPCDGGSINGGSWDASQEPYLYRGIGHANEHSPPAWKNMYDNAQKGISEPLGGHSDPDLHAGGTTESEFTSWTTYYEEMALEESYRGNGPGIVLRIPNADGAGYSRVPGVNFPYDEGEVMIKGRVTGAEMSLNGGTWTRTN